jgi:hypothetical protein
VVGSTANGEILPDGSTILCVTANSLDAGSIVHLNLCQTSADARQQWHIQWIRLDKKKNTGAATVCLIGHPHLCLGVGSFERKHNFAPAHIYTPDGTPRQHLANAITLFRSGAKWKFAADALFGFRLTTREGGRGSVKFGEQLVWKKPAKPDPTTWTLPRMHQVK